MATGKASALGRKSQSTFAAVRYVFIALLAAGAVVLNVTSYKFMGMNRQVKFMYHQLEDIADPNLIFWGGLALVLAALAAGVVLWLRGPDRSRKAAVAALLVALAVAALAACLVIFDVQGTQGLASYASKPAGFYARILALPVAYLASLLASLNAALIARQDPTATSAHIARQDLTPADVRRATAPTDTPAARTTTDQVTTADEMIAEQQKNAEDEMIAKNKKVDTGKEVAAQHADTMTPEESADNEKIRATRRVARIATIVTIAVVVVICVAVPSIRTGIGHVFALLSSGDVNAVIELIRSYGVWAAAVSCALMILQSLAAPIPAFLITFANAAIFGWIAGAALSWSSAMLGAAICFGIARVLGRDAVAHFATRGALETVDRFFERYGKSAILVCRLLPFMSFDLVSYAAGLTGMGFWGFMLATGVGQLPATIVYSYVGGMLTGGTKLFVTALFIIFALAALVMLARQVYVNRHRKATQSVAAATVQDTGAAGAAPESKADNGQ